MQIPQVFASGTRAQESVFLCTVFPIRPPNHAPPCPGTPAPGVRDHTEGAWGQERGGPRPVGDRGVVQGAGGRGVELIGVLAQTGWVLMRPEGTPPGTR